MSKLALAKITPVTPPRENKKIKPIMYRVGVANQIEPPYRVAIQLNSLIEVGTAITIVAALKQALESTDNPTVNIRRLQTRKPRKAIETIAADIPIFPKICFLEKHTVIRETRPKPGIIKM